jgi:hypothetical protein
MEKSGMTLMKAHFTGLVVAALLIAGLTLPGYAEDAAAPTAPAAAQKEAAPASVPRPSLAPKTAEPASAPATTESDARPPRRYAHRRWHSYGYYRTAYWEPFPIYWPHLYRSRIHWGRIPWFSF